MTLDLDEILAAENDVAAARARLEREFFYALDNDVELLIDLAKASSAISRGEPSPIPQAARKVVDTETRKENSRRRWHESKAGRQASLE